VLDVGNNALTAASAPTLARLLASDNARAHLRELSVYMNELRDDGVGALAERLAGCSALRVLDLGGNEVTSRGAGALAAMLMGGRRPSNSGRSGTGAGAGGGFGGGYGGGGGGGTNKGGAGAGAEPLHPPPLALSLRTLELGYNPLGPEGVAAIAGAFQTADARLEALKLGWCKAGGGGGAAALADLLLLNASLRVLDLRGNSLGNEGAVRIARALGSHANGRLEELDLGYNEVRDDGACALARALKANAGSAPGEIRMAQNYVTRFGQVALQEAVDMVFELGEGRRTSVQF